MRIWQVYILKDPRDASIRYVGCSTNAKRRYYAHLDTNRKRESKSKIAWISDLLSNGLRPLLEVVADVEEPDWPEAERRWLAHFRELGCPLTNLATGGKGVPGYRSPNVVPVFGRKMPAHVKEILLAANRGRKRPDTAEINRARSCTPEERKRRSERQRGRKYGPETKAKVSEANRKRWEMHRAGVAPFRKKRARFHLQAAEGGTCAEK